VDSVSPHPKKLKKNRKSDSFMSITCGSINWLKIYLILFVLLSPASFTDTFENCTDYGANQEVDGEWSMGKNAYVWWWYPETCQYGMGPETQMRDRQNMWIRRWSTEYCAAMFGIMENVSRRHGVGMQRIQCTKNHLTGKCPSIYPCAKVLRQSFRWDYNYQAKSYSFLEWLVLDHTSIYEF
jgi:hypothetical protein